MSRVIADHIFLLASEPSHPLAASGLTGWTVERTELRPTSHMPDSTGWVDNVQFIHYVSPPAEPHEHVWSCKTDPSTLTWNYRCDGCPAEITEGELRYTITPPARTPAFFRELSAMWERKSSAVQGS